MANKWLAREGERWVNEDIITREQLERIRRLYDNAPRSVGLLPLLGGLLVGLGVISFVAANWQELPEWFRIALLMAAMVAGYLGGQRLMDKGYGAIGIAVVGIGLFAFGGGLILINQMFHMVTYSALTVNLWAAAGIALAWLYRSRYIAAVSLVLVTAAQWYSIASFDSFSYTAAALLVAGLGYFALRVKPDRLVTTVWSLSVALHAFLCIMSNEWDFAWFFVPIVLLYAAGNVPKSQELRQALQFGPLAAAFIAGVVLALFTDEFANDWLTEMQADPAWFFPALALLLAGSAYAKHRINDWRTVPDWILFVPFLYLTPTVAALGYLAALFLYSLYLLLKGYSEQSKLQIHTGTGLFLLSTMVAYFKLTWAFMDKSLFFLVGGALLLGLSWFLNWKNRQVLQSQKEG